MIMKPTVAGATGAVGAEDQTELTILNFPAAYEAFGVCIAQSGIATDSAHSRRLYSHPCFP